MPLVRSLPLTRLRDAEAVRGRDGRSELASDAATLPSEERGSAPSMLARIMRELGKAMIALWLLERRPARREKLLRRGCRLFSKKRGAPAARCGVAARGQHT